MYGNDAAKKPTQKKSSKFSLLLNELDSSDDEELPARKGRDVAKPWQKEFIQWMEHEESVKEGTDIVTWWGVSIFLIVSCYASNDPCDNSNMSINTQFGHLLPLTIWLLWDLPFQMSVLFRRVVS